MGSQSEQKCIACGYSAVVSGRKDRGFEATTVTIVCADCRDLYDVQDGWSLPFPGRKTPKVRCPESASHKFIPWTSGDPCPRCAGEMREGDLQICWD